MHSLLTRWRRTAALASTVVVAAAALSAVPATPAQAQQSCLTATISANTWSTGSGGGFVLNIAITNTCQAPVAGWTLRLTLPPDHTAHSGWSARWTIWERQVTATGDGWSAVIPPGGSLNIGLIGTNAGTFHDPQDCTINGFPCDGVGGNQPPEVTLTSPEAGFGTPITCPAPLAAEATDPDGAIDRVEFYVNGELVATDDTAPYEAEASGPGGHLVEGENTAFARAYDDGDPALSTDSEPVTFTMLPPLPSSPGDCDSPLPPIEVTLTSPTGVMPSPCPVRFAADAIDNDGSVQLVEFYANGTLVGSDDQAPYEVTIPGNHPALSGSANHTAYARAYDDEEPPLSGFSEEVEFTQAPPPPALMLIACNRPDALAPGSSHVVHFQSVCGVPEVDVELTVTGDPGITADPTSFPLGPDGQDVTISTAPDSAGATATVRAQTVEACLPAAVEVTVAG